MNKSQKKQLEYFDKYGDIPVDYNERLLWMMDYYKINQKQAQDIISQRDDMINQLQYFTYKVILYEEPEGAKRPRFRFCKKSISSGALDGFVHVYSPGASEGHNKLRRLLDSNEIYQLDSLVNTPCRIVFNAYFKTPSYFNKAEKFLAEVGLENPITKPDWDNIGKKYSDMYNSNVWIDDALTIGGQVNKYYSILPRVEVDLYFLNMYQNKHQYNNMIKRVEDLTRLQYYQYGGI